MERTALRLLRLQEVRKKWQFPILNMPPTKTCLLWLLLLIRMTILSLQEEGSVELGQWAKANPPSLMEKGRARKAAPLEAWIVTRPSALFLCRRKTFLLLKRKEAKVLRRTTTKVKRASTSFYPLCPRHRRPTAVVTKPIIKRNRSRKNRGEQQITVPVAVALRHPLTKAVMVRLKVQTSNRMTAAIKEEKNSLRPAPTHPPTRAYRRGKRM